MFKDTDNLSDKAKRAVEDATDEALQRPLSNAELTFHVNVLRSVCTLQQDQIVELRDELGTLISATSLLVDNLKKQEDKG